MRCSICDGQIEVIGDWTEGHNAQPVNDGRCCGWCNDAIVVPVRIKQMLDLRNKPEPAEGGAE